MTTVVGLMGNAGYADGNATIALLSAPRGITASTDGSALYICDADNHRIREFNMTTGALPCLRAGLNSCRWRPCAHVRCDAVQESCLRWLEMVLLHQVTVLACTRPSIHPVKP